MNIDALTERQTIAAIVEQYDIACAEVKQAEALPAHERRILTTIEN